MLNTFDVKWESISRKFPDSELIKITRVVSNSLENAVVYVKETYQNDFLKLIEVKLIPPIQKCSCECHKD